jgi:hypothetical protein
MIAAILVGTGMVACLVPGTRATRIEPLVVLRARVEARGRGLGSDSDRSASPGSTRVADRAGR